MNKWIKVSIILIGVLLMINGLINIMDDSRILTFDITSMLAGLGFVLVSRLK